jgi:integrase/recombinase XerD
MTPKLQSDERRCRPVDQWPQSDRQRWQTALQPGDLLEQGGCRAEHSRYSNRAIEKGYGRWLAWLDREGLLDDRALPADRITPDRVKAYAEHLQGENASGTVIARLIELKVTAAIMDPGRDWSWIYRMASVIRARHKPARPKRPRLVPIEELFGLGLNLMARAETEATPLRGFTTYRDGLMIALLASRPLRLRNLTGLTLGRTLVRRGEVWWIQIPAAETKTKVPIELPWPEVLAPQLEIYLAHYRSAIVALRGTGVASDALWLSLYGPPMTDNAIYIRIVARTREELGRRSTRTYFEIPPRQASRSQTRHILASPPVCSDIAADRRPNAITTKRAVSKRAVSCKNRFWSSVMASLAPPPTDKIP